MPFDPMIPLLGLFPKMIRGKGKEPIWSKMFIVAIFMIAKNWTFQGCP